MPSRFGARLARLKRTPLGATHVTEPRKPSRLQQNVFHQHAGVFLSSHSVQWHTILAKAMKAQGQFERSAAGARDRGRAMLRSSGHKSPAGCNEKKCLKTVGTRGSDSSDPPVSSIVPKQCSMSRSLPSKLAPQPPEKSVSPVKSASRPQEKEVETGCIRVQELPECCQKRKIISWALLDPRYPQKLKRGSVAVHGRGFGLKGSRRAHW